MENINNINYFLQKAVFVDKIAFLSINLKKGYQLSILTASHFDSAKLGTIEVALMRNGFAFDEAIIDHMPYSLWLDFIGDIQQAKPDEYEQIFKEYKTI
jgi:hypothetical protein